MISLQLNEMLDREGLQHVLSEQSLFCCKTIVYESVSKHGRTLLKKVFTPYKNTIKNRCMVVEHFIEMPIELQYKVTISVSNKCDLFYIFISYIFSHPTCFGPS
jgi:hypothetical protein